MMAPRYQHKVLLCEDIDLINVHDLTVCKQGRQENFWAPRQKVAFPPPPILQIMVLMLSPPRCVIRKESAQQK